MSFNTPQQTAEAAVASGTAKAALTPPKALVGGFLAGSYIAMGGLLGIVVSAGLVTTQWGGLITLFTGLVFSLGLVLVVVGGAELVTGNFALIPIAVLAGRTSIVKMLINWVFVFIGNIVGSLFVAYVLADKTGIIAKTGSASAVANYKRLGALAMGKAVTETHSEQFLRGIGCNWLVCLAIWLALAATDVPGKILGIVFPITAFVAMGFDHVVANLFFLPLAMFVHTGGVTAANMMSNLVWALLGNLVGALVFVAGAYWYMYLSGNKTATPQEVVYAPASAPEMATQSA